MKKRNLKQLIAKVTFVLVMILLSIVITSCSGKNDLTGKAYSSAKISLQCSGEASALLSDNCFDPESRTLKLLVLNGNLADLKHLNVELIGDKSTDSLRFGLNIEMGESKLLYVEWPTSLGNPVSAKLHVFYFGNTGLENCVPFILNMDDVRICGKPQKEELQVEETY